MAIKHKIVLALQGGGSHGAFTWGILDRFLEEESIQIEGLSGSSAGAMNSASIVQGISGGPQHAQKMLSNFWKAVGNRHTPMPFNLQGSKYNLNNTYMWYLKSMMDIWLSPYQTNPFDLNILKDIVREVFDFDLINNSPIKLFLSAINVKNGKIKIFSNMNKEISDKSLLASACLPVISQSVQIDGNYYWDGGYIANPAIYPLIDNCTADNIIVIQLRKLTRNVLPTTSYEIGERIQEITYNGCLLRELRAIKFISDLIDQGKIVNNELRRVYVHLINDDEFFDDLNLSSALNTDPNFLQYLYDGGRKAATKWLDKNLKNLSSKHGIEESYFNEIM